ncbi:MAG: ABC transporter permease [Planctomycetaceae bacterium]
MKHAFFLAWRNLTVSPVRTVILVACLTISVSLPIVMHVMADQSQSGLQTRASQTPLIVGAPGSRFDLALHALYFETGAPAELTLSEADFIRGTGYALPVPIYARFRCQGYRIVGTTEEYFPLRKLTVDRGRGLSQIGDCVVGATVATQLHVNPGDHLTSEPENIFDPTGSYPLRMRVRGIFAASGSPGRHSHLCFASDSLDYRRTRTRSLESD